MRPWNTDHHFSAHNKRAPNFVSAPGAFIRDNTVSALQDWADRCGDVLQPLEMLGPEGVQAEIKKPGIPVHPER